MVGEHIRALKGGRWVHAIDCGDETVLHLVEEAPPPRVRRAYRPEFVAGSDAVEVVTHRERTFPPKEVVRRAYSRASDPALAAMFRDSEAFAEWCKTGRLSGARNVALEVPGFAPPSAAAPSPAGPARAAAVRKAAGAKRAKSRTAAAAKAKSRGSTKRKAKRAAPRPKASRAAARKGASKTRRGAKPARRTRR
jgi:hypothetical protein